MKIFFKILGHVLVFIILTALTQVGGVIWLFSVLISTKFHWKKRIVFPLLYFSFNLLVIPSIAPLFGRTALPVTSAEIKPQNYFYPLAFRNYVNPELKDILIKSSQDLSNYGIAISYLDANFPFINGFPLLPHLSHNDGKKIDIAFQYKTEDGVPTHKKPSLLGYGIYTDSKNPTSAYCKQKGYWQYDITKYLGIEINSSLLFDKENTKKLIQELLKLKKTTKLFLEPYLKQDLGLQNYPQVRFHGCHAVRHDDHIHMEVK